MTATDRRVEIVDYARFAAAVGVVGFHYLYNGIANGKVSGLTHIEPFSDIARYGYLGVDMFFLISGFVIANSAVGKTASRFAVGRVVRLYPTFWVAMTITTIFALLLSPPFMHVTFGDFLANLTMVPNVFGQPFIDGAYWTLGYELTFYLAVFVAMVLGLGRWLDEMLAIWLIFMSATSLLMPDVAERIPLLGGYFLLFGSGAVISAIRRRGWSVLRALALVLGFTFALRFELRSVSDHIGPTVLVTAMTILMFGLLLATLWRPVAQLRLPGSALLGQLTYPLYLVHAHIGYMLIDRFATEQNKLWITMLTFLAVLLIAATLHIIVERRMKRFWYVAADRSVGAVVRFVERLTRRAAGATGGAQGRGGETAPVMAPET